MLACEINTPGQSTHGFEHSAEIEDLDTFHCLRKDAILVRLFTALLCILIAYNLFTRNTNIRT